MQDRIARMYQRMLGVMQEEMGGLLDEQLAGLVKSLGIDISQIKGMMGQQAAAFDPYRVLGLERSASDEEVKKRYRQLLRDLHPDTTGGEGSAFLLQMAMMAYEVIKRERGWQ